MAVLDYTSIPEATRQSLLAATYKFAEELLKDPAVRAECEEWKRQRKRSLRDCRNDLCLRCGRYTEAHNGACDGCHWQIKAEGSE